jgi:hypothetical protein
MLFHTVSSQSAIGEPAGSVDFLLGLAEGPDRSRANLPLGTGPFQATRAEGLDRAASSMQKAAAP